MEEHAVTADAPDKNCVTLPDGDCVGVGCMHNPDTRAAVRTVREDRLRAIADGPVHDTIYRMAVELLALRQARDEALPRLEKAHKALELNNSRATGRALIESARAALEATRPVEVER